jgi:DNA polymerase (family 10)
MKEAILNRREAINLFGEILDKIWFKANIEPAGSFRRGLSEIGDMDLLIISEDGTIPDRLKKSFSGEDYETIESGGKIFRVKDKKRNFQIDFYSASDEKQGSMLLYLTGSKDFNIGMRLKAKRLGYKLSQNGLFKDGNLVESRSEESIFKILGYNFIPPKERTNWFEVSKMYKIEKEDMIYAF